MFGACHALGVTAAPWEKAEVGKGESCTSQGFSSLGSSVCGSTLYFIIRLGVVGSCGSYANYKLPFIKTGKKNLSENVLINSRLSLTVGLTQFLMLGVF